MINKVVLIGRLTKDIEVQKTPNGVSVTRFTLACNRMKTQNNQDPGADFISCVAWRHSAEFLSKYVKKGYLIGVEGHIQTRTYESYGQRNYVTEVICETVELLSSPKDNGQSVQNSDLQLQTPEFEEYTGVELSADDLPF